MIGDMPQTKAEFVKKINDEWKYPKLKSSRASEVVDVTPVWNSHNKVWDKVIEEVDG